MEWNWFALLLQQKVMPPDDLVTWVHVGLRTVHLLAGITWIGLLYFFNLVNVPVMKQLEAPVRSKVVPVLMPKALWWFRWGAVVTVLAGFIFWLLILMTEPHSNPGSHMGRTVGIWLAVVIVTWAIIYALIRTPAISKDGRVLGAVVLILVALMGGALVHLNTYEGASNRAMSIGVGGGLGMIMLLNVWGVIWRAQKRIIAWTKENVEKGTAVPAESAVLARQAFLASRTNAWLSIPMLFFMAAASHFPMFVGG